MTFGNTSIGRTVSRTRLLLKKQLWIWPIIAVILLAVIGFGVSRSIRSTMEETLRSQLQTLLNVEQSMLEKWFRVQESRALTLANDAEIRETVRQLLATESDSPDRSNIDTSDDTPARAALQSQFGKRLEAAMSSNDFVGYVLFDRRQKILSAYSQELVGRPVPAQYESFVAKTLEGRTTVSTPFASIVMLKDRSGKLRSGVATMFVCAPVRDENLQVVAALAMRIRPEKEFTSILQLGQIGRTGETYAVNQRGLLVSNSRFDEQLILLGLLPDDDQSASILNIQVRDPGGSLQQGFRPKVRRKELPLTSSCLAVANGTTGVDVAGYRNYRGERAVGAWTWIADYEMGLITEMDASEAYRPLTILQYAFYLLFALLGVCAAAIFVFTLVVARLQKQAQKAAVEAKQLGQYRLLEKIGEGAMGVVYKGQHAMLRRPTAIKMLDVDRINEASIQRFEREVQITCKLNNPHTVAIYDYGRTPEGVFYYAMEYLDGIDLQKLVDEYGPQPEGRVISILRQICTSLYEAHSLGLVHRDIKPANIMLNRRGAEPDVVKVLDFGLVKALEDKKESGQVSSDPSGTPLYMSPEAIQTPDLVDGRSDLYAVGAVGYFLLTGQTAFSAHTLAELCQLHITAVPDAPSQRLGRPISEAIEHAILSCLEKSRAKRPQTARDLSEMLNRANGIWTLDEAESWWSRHERGQVAPRDRGGYVPSTEHPGKATSMPTSTGHTAPNMPPSAPADSRAGLPELPGNLDRTTIFQATDEDDAD